MVDNPRRGGEFRAKLFQEKVPLKPFPKSLLPLLHSPWKPSSSGRGLGEGRKAPVNIFIDMDYTILSVIGVLRPGTEKLFRRLREDGHTLYIWSGVGVRREEVRRLGLEGYVAGVFEKPVIEYQQRVLGMLRRGEIPVHPDLIVDDHPEMVSALGGVVVQPYVNSDPADTELERVYRIISDYAAGGTPADPAFRAGPATPQE